MGSTEATTSPLTAAVKEAAYWMSRPGSLSKDIMRCHELVRIVARDTQRLAEMRDDHLQVLRSEDPDGLVGIIDAIGSSERIIEEVGRFIGPASGKKTLMKRLSWTVTVDDELVARECEVALVTQGATVLNQLDRLEDFLFSRMTSQSGMEMSGGESEEETDQEPEDSGVPRKHSAARLRRVLADDSKAGESERVPRVQRGDISRDFLPKIDVSGLDLPTSFSAAFASLDLVQPESSGAQSSCSPLPPPRIMTESPEPVSVISSASAPRTLTESPEPVSAISSASDFSSTRGGDVSPMQTDSPASTERSESPLPDLVFHSASVSHGRSSGELKRYRWSSLPGMETRSSSLPGRREAAKSRIMARRSLLPRPGSDLGFVSAESRIGARQRANSDLSIASSVYSTCSSSEMQLDRGVGTVKRTQTDPDLTGDHEPLPQVSRLSGSLNFSLPVPKPRRKPSPLMGVPILPMEMEIPRVSVQPATPATPMSMRARERLSEALQGVTPNSAAQTTPKSEDKSPLFELEGDQGPGTRLLDRKGKGRRASEDWFRRSQMLQLGEGALPLPRNVS